MSVKNGRSNFLLRKAITRKERLQKDEEDKHNDEILKNVPRLERQIEDLKKEVLEQKYELERNEEERVILQKLYDQGYIDEDGNVLK